MPANKPTFEDAIVFMALIFTALMVCGVLWGLYRLAWRAIEAVQAFAG